MRQFKIVLYGATGYTGTLTAEYLSDIPNIKWAIAGRDEAKLLDLQKRLKRHNPKNAPGVIIANAADLESLDVMASQCDVLISTVGPFTKYGLPVVEACLRQKTDYVDSTGEPFFIKKCIEMYHEAAEKAQIKIVPSCGFDSLPSDLGTLLLVNYFKSKNLKPISVEASIQEFRAGLSGGTINSTTNVWGGSSFWEILSLARNIDFYVPGSFRPNKKWPMFWDKDIQGYQTPFVMEPGNTRYVRRSNHLLNYSSEFYYHEGMFASSFLAALFMTIVYHVLILALFLPPVRWGFNYMYPPGTGSTREILKKGKLSMKFVGKGRKEDGDEVVKCGHITFNMDPGYAGTALLLAESAMCLLDKSETKLKGGVLTGAAAMGNKLIDRLNNAGVDIVLEK